MDLGLTDAQELLKRTARAFLEESCPSTLVREVESRGDAFCAPLWDQMAALGWLGLGIPATLGGEGGDAVDLAIVAAELGRALAPVPWLSTFAHAVPILRAAGGAAADGVLREVAAGRARLAVAVREDDAGYGPGTIAATARRAGDGWVVDGVKRFVPDAAEATALIVLARVGEGAGADGLTAFLVDPGTAGVWVRREPTVATTGADSVDLQAAAGVLLGEVGGGWALLEAPTTQATVLLCAWMVAAAEHAMAMATSYATERVQFGRPIGSFQAISHKLADMRLKLDIAKGLTWGAVRALAAGDDAAAEASMAKAWTNTATRWALYRCHEIFAGLGFMKIHDVQLFFRRLKLAESLLGDELHHRRQVVATRVLPLAAA